VLTVSGTGITNDSGVAQNFVLETDVNNDSSSIAFTGTAMVSTLTTITVEGNSSGTFNWGASASFYDHSSAGDGTFHCLGGSVPPSAGAVTGFNGDSTAGTATLTSDGGLVAGAGGGVIWFFDSSNAGEAVITCNGGAVAGAGGGFITFDDNSSTRDATLIANGEVSGADGGTIVFNGKGSASARPRVQLYGNGQLYLQGADGPVYIGSVEGDGIISLANKLLIVGSNDLSTSFFGTITGYNTEPSLIKIGIGTLTLSGSNTYTGSTTVSEGALVVDNTTGSGTGTGPMTVAAGTLGGSGIIAGAVTIGTGSGTGAFLAPAAGTNVQATLTIQSALTFNADATYTYTFKKNRNGTKTDQVIANGVTINNGAMIALSGQTRSALRQGRVLTLISNTSANPISGTFNNLPDGAIVAINGNNLQASYEGGDGNDLTLTVVP
jgi:autotransporter-associated beta strand protein